MQTHNGMIDVLRFIFSTVIVIHHSYMLTVPNTRPAFFDGGWIFVEFFFFLSGLLMVESEMKRADSKSRNAGGKEWIAADIRFLFRKVGRIYPYFLAAFAIEFLVKEILSQKTLLQAIFDLVKSVWTLSFIYMIGLPSTDFMGMTWYISAMLLSMAILYPFLYKNKELFLRVIAPVIALVSYVWMDACTGGNGLGYGAVTEWIGVCYFGMLRAMGGIALGAIIWSAANYLQTKKRSIKIILTVLECIGYAYVVYRAWNPVSNEWTYILLVILAFCLMCTFSNCTYSGRLVKGKFCKYLGRLSLSIYLCQFSSIFVIWFLAERCGWIPYQYESMLPYYLLLNTLMSVILEFTIARLITRKSNKGLT